MTESLNLLPRHYKELVSLFRTHLPDVEVWAYGSRTNGQSHDGSDLDLVIRGPNLQKIPTNQLVELKDALRESRIPFIVEVVDWARIPERFHSQIIQHHVTLLRPNLSETNSLETDNVNDL
ncbi:MAG: nucleotidyltransferase domain-containing protein [Bacteroidetes bacterium]|nr:nucleotidyltransferase domain-containing protein [Bacteroidota bacterium]